MTNQLYRFLVVTIQILFAAIQKQTLIQLQKQILIRYRNRFWFTTKTLAPIVHCATRQFIDQIINQHSEIAFAFSVSLAKSLSCDLIVLCVARPHLADKEQPSRLQANKKSGLPYWCSKCTIIGGVTFSRDLILLCRVCQSDLPYLIRGSPHKVTTQ